MLANELEILFLIIAQVPVFRFAQEAAMLSYSLRSRDRCAKLQISAGGSAKNHRSYILINQSLRNSAGRLSGSLR